MGSLFVLIRRYAGIVRQMEHFVSRLRIKERYIGPASPGLIYSCLVQVSCNLKLRSHNHHHHLIMVLDGGKLEVIDANHCVVLW